MQRELERWECEEFLEKSLGQFRDWLEESPEEVVRDVLGALKFFDPIEIAKRIAWDWDGTDTFKLSEFFDAWEAEWESRVDGYVYVLEGGGFCKIGRTVDVDTRVEQLKIQLPFEVSLVHYIPCSDYVAAEKRLHEELGEYRVNGEWFKLDKDKFDWLLSIEKA